MFRLFSPKSEVCDVFKIDNGLHVLIRQPRRTGSFDRSNSTAGFLVFDDVLPEAFLIQESTEASSLETSVLEISKETGLPVEIYSPKIALLPPEGGTNEGLLSFLNSREGVSIDLIDSIELGLTNRNKIFKGVSKDHKISILGRALTNSGSIKGALRATQQFIRDDFALVRVHVNADDSRLQKTVAFLREVGLAREETLTALAFVVDKFVFDKKSYAHNAINKRDLVSEIDRLIKQGSQPQPA